MINEIFKLSEKVKNAIENNEPLIALESTIISHGMPYPANRKVANELENIADENGVTPATICLMNGKIHIGLDNNELEILAKSNNVKKVSRRNIGYVLSNKEIGATTVAATMLIANMFKIQIFATGGIGGVHRNVSHHFDISADLIEFSKTPVIVISAGAKAILDLPKTLEILETLGVPVYGYKTDYFPAFYSSKTDLQIERVDKVNQVVNIYEMNRRLGFSNGILIANPIPKEFEIPFQEMEIYIRDAVSIAEKKKITGQALTPFLLKKIVEITKGKSLESNIMLVKNNVILACQIAKELS